MTRTKNRTQPTAKDALHYQSLAFRDYLGARHLLLGDFLIQGITLSSTAIEKYLKFLLCVRGIRTDKHLDQLGIFKSFFRQHIPGFIDRFDLKYLQLLAKAYELRYYDKVNALKTFGFFKWQVLGELDFMADIIERYPEIKNANDTQRKLGYLKSVEVNDPKVWNENYVLNGLDKKQFMERDGPSCMFLFDQSIGETFGSNELVVDIKAGRAEYNGEICTATLKPAEN